MTAPQDLTDERAAFEAWADSREKATLRSSTSGDFDYPLGHLLWEAWSARAALAGAAAAIPEGFVLVPVEPTREMMDAGAAHAIRVDEDEDKYRARGQAIAIYSDMLAAAPGAAAPLASTEQAATPAQAVEEAGMAQAQDEFTSEWLFKNCRIVFFPPDGQYPVEHNPRALGYDKDGSNFKNNIRAALRAATKEQQ